MEREIDYLFDRILLADTRGILKWDEEDEEDEEDRDIFEDVDEITALKANGGLD